MSCKDCCVTEPDSCLPARLFLSLDSAEISLMWPWIEQGCPKVLLKWTEWTYWLSWKSGLQALTGKERYLPFGCWGNLPCPALVRSVSHLLYVCKLWHSLWVSSGKDISQASTVALCLCGGKDGEVILWRSLWMCWVSHTIRHFLHFEEIAIPSITNMIFNSLFPMAILTVS